MNHEHDNQSLNIGQPADVPVFDCIVYVSKTDAGVSARVANLDGMDPVQMSSERAALAKLVPLFKQRIQQLIETGEAVPWLQPPLEIRTDEQERYLPVHL